MLFIRSLIYFVLMVISIIVFGLAIGTVGRLFPLNWRDRMARQWGWINILLLKWICRLDYRLQGAEYLPNEAAIVMCKHQSTWETITLKYIIPPQQSWILKQELMRIPVFGWALAAIPNIPIDRKAGRKAMNTIIEQGTRLLHQGRIIIIFPEGTRTHPGERHKYGIGGGMLAQKSGFPVIPIAHNAGVFWKRRGFIKYPGTIDVIVGPPIDTRGLKASEITRKVETWIEEQVAKLPQTPPQG